MDNYIEQIVETTAISMTTTLKYVFGILLIIAGIGTAVVGVDLTISLILLIIGVVLIALAKNGSYLEYEYEITQGDFSIDMIMNKSSRKNAYEFLEGDIQRIITYTNPKFQNELEVNKSMIVKDYTSGIEDNKENWYAFMINHDKKTVAVILEFNEKSQSYIDNYFKRKVEK